MVRRTSIDAYNYIKNNGLLSARRWKTYDALFRWGPCTANELFKKMQLNHEPYLLNTNVVTRLGELRTLGCAYEVQTRVCTISGMTVIEWDVTDRLPVDGLAQKPKRTWWLVERCAPLNTIYTFKDKRSADAFIALHPKDGYNAPVCVKEYQPRSQKKG